MISANVKPRKKEVDDILWEIGRLKDHIGKHVHLQPDGHCAHHAEVERAMTKIWDLVRAAEKDHPEDIAEIKGAASGAFILAPPRSSSIPNPVK